MSTVPIFNETQLKAMNKDKVIAYALQIHAEHSTLDGISEKLDNALIEFKKLNDRFVKIESQLSVSHHINKVFTERITQLERKCWANEQYSRRECIEISGIPSSVTNEQLEPKVIELLGKIDVSVSSEKIEACHRIGKEGERTIVKFSRRKDCFAVLTAKKGFKSIDLSDIGIKTVYINESLCGYYKKLWYSCKKLYKNEYIHAFWTSNGTVKIRIHENGKVHAISHETDLSILFPDVDITNLVV